MRISFFAIGVMTLFSQETLVDAVPIVGTALPPRYARKVEVEQKPLQVPAGWKVVDGGWTTTDFEESVNQQVEESEYVTETTSE